MGININTATPVAGGAAIGGIETSVERLFRTCKGTATRAARSLSRMIDRLIHSRPRNVPLVRAQTNSQRRASIRKLDFSSVGSSRFQDTQVSPGGLSSQSMPNCVLRSPSGTPSSFSSMPIPGVRLKPGRSAGALPTPQPVSGGRPALPARPPGLGDPFYDRAAQNASPTPASIPGIKPALPPRSRSADSSRSEPPSQARSADSGNAPSLARSRSEGSLGAAPVPPSIAVDGRPAPPSRSKSADRAGSALSMPVFHRPYPAGPITTQVEGAAPLPKPPGNGEPPR
ncbi:hypothetical protein [Bordetella sp. H567]|uniref:hypothetical protein n=1 Tax=Bordetella sp. H567 TaxID=1697043 RepID=UPI0011AB684A|nr:hypothetical protein [Bordetella sp. H567]